MMRASSQMAGARASDRPRPRPLRATARFAGHVLVLACWTLVVVMGLITWGPHATRYKTDIIIGQSMEPTIPLYSVIVVEPVDPDAIRAGDVITYQQPGLEDRKVTHRVQSIERGKDGSPTFITKGDNNEVRDPYEVTYAGTGYRVKTHVPHVGWLMIKAQTRWARVLLVALPVLVLLVQLLRWIWRDERGDDEQGDEVDELRFDMDPEAYGWERAA
jgi:signal peptidase I